MNSSFNKHGVSLTQKRYKTSQKQVMLIEGNGDQMPGMQLSGKAGDINLQKAMYIVT